MRHRMLGRLYLSLSYSLTFIIYWKFYEVDGCLMKPDIQEHFSDLFCEASKHKSLEWLLETAMFVLEWRELFHSFPDFEWMME